MADPADSWHTWSDDYCGDERDREGYEDYDREEPPEFGCACENAMIVDTTCRACCLYLAEQHAAALREELAAVEASIREMEREPEDK